MADVPAPRDAGASSALLTCELSLGEARREVLAPKLAAVLAQFRQIDVLEDLNLEPAPQIPEQWERDERR